MNRSSMCVLSRMGCRILCCNGLETGAGKTPLESAMLRNVILLAFWLLVTATALPVRADSIPHGKELDDLGKKLAEENGSTKYHTYSCSRGALVAVEIPGEVEERFPYVVLYLYDPLRGGGSDHRGLAQRLYFQEKEKREQVMGREFAGLCDGVDRKSQTTIRELTPNIERAYFVAMTSQVNDIIGGLCATNAPIKLFWLFSQGAKSLSLSSAHSEAEFTYGKLLDDLEDAHYKTSQRTNAVDQLLFRISGPATWADRGLKVHRLLEIAETYDLEWETYQMELKTLEMTDDLDLVKDYQKYYQLTRARLALQGIVRLGPGLAKLAFSDKKCEKLRVLLVQAYYHAFAAKAIARQCMAKITAYRASPTPELAHDVVMTLGHASINIELAIRLQAAVVQSNRDGDLGGQILAWLYENFISDNRSIDQNIQALQDLADSFASLRQHMLDIEVPYVEKLTISAREIRPLPWQPNAAKIIATATPLVLEERPWHTRLYGNVLTDDAMPVNAIDVVIEDPIHHTTAMVKTDETGAFFWNVDCRSAEPGLYTFLCTVERIKPVAVVVSVLPSPKALRTSGHVDAPIGAWENPLAETDSACFALTHRSQTSVIGGALATQMADVAESTGRALVDYWSPRIDEFPGQNQSDVVRVYGLGQPDGFDNGKSGQLVAVDLLYGIHTGKRESWVTFINHAISSSAASAADREALRRILEDPHTLLAGFVVDPYSGICGWPEDVDHAAPRETIVQMIPGQDGVENALVQIQFRDNPRIANVCVISPAPNRADNEGMLDVVILIDKSGSMSDDIRVVKQEVDTILDGFDAIATSEKISLRVGLATFSYTGTSNVFELFPLAERSDEIRQFVTRLNARDVGGDEDLYSALMYVMNEPVDGKQIDMGWRAGAAKIAIPITDEPAKTDNFTLDQVRQVAKDLDPVHMYPLLMPKSPLSWLDPAVSSMKELAAKTGGEAVQVESADKLPAAIIAAVKLAIRRHKEEVWRKDNTPYLLYGVGAGIGVIVVFGLGVLLVRGTGREGALQTASPPADPLLTGQISTHAKKTRQQ